MEQPLGAEQLCAAISEFCGAGAAAAAAAGSGEKEAGLLEERAKELLAFSRELRSLLQQKGVAQRVGATQEALEAPKPAGAGPSRRGAGARRGASPAAGRSRRSSAARWADAAPEAEGFCSQLGLGLCAVAVTLPYYVCVRYTTWFVDEGFAIHRNPDARGETPVLEVLKHDFWGTALKPPEGYNTHKSYRPLVTLCYAAEWRLAARLGLGGREMQPMRLLSCLVHSLNALAVLRLLRRLRVPRAWALLGAALFAAHPVHVENIVYLVGRADSLATLFSIAAVLVYLRRTCGPKAALPCQSYLALVTLAAVAGLCKEPGFTVLFFLACAEVVLRARWRHFFGLLLCFAAVGGLRTWYVGGAEAGFGYVDTPIRYQDSRLTRTLSYLYQHAYYAKLLVLPWNQSWDYSYDALPMLHSLEDVRMLAIAAAYLAVAALAAFGLRRCQQQPAVILGLGLTVIPFVPASNLFFLVGTTVGERLLYPCTVGWVVLVAALGSGAGPATTARKPPGSSGRRPLLAAFCGLLGVYVWNSNVRMRHWRGASELFETDALHWSRSVKVVHSKASELQARGELQGALEHYLQSLRIFDDQAITDYCIARIYINLGRFQEAYARFEKILNGHGIGLHDGNDFLWMTDFGYVLVQLGANEQGIHYLREGLQRMPYSCYAWNALGVAQSRMQQLEQAVQSFMEGLQCEPDSVSIWSNLAVVYAYGNLPQQALEALQRASALDPARPAVVSNTRVLMGQGLPGEEPLLDLYIPLPGRR